MVLGPLPRVALTCSVCGSALLVQASIQSMYFLVGSGFVIFTLEGFTVGFLHFNSFRMREREG